MLFPMSDPITRLNAALEGRYRIERELGEGGMATVYLANDIKHERKVALKVLKPELAAVVGAERFLAEIKTTANLTHPHVLPLFDSGEADSFLFYVMPYVEGETLRDRIDREKQLPVDEAVALASKVAGALQHAHEHGVIHRDIKPGNILLQDGEPVVADFGIALAVGAAGSNRLTETGLSLGTPYYMSPEQATGDQPVGASTDTYALGSVLYEMLVGEPPYPGTTAQAVLGKIIAGKRVSATEERPSVPANVDAAIRKALERLPADRFASAQDFARALADEHFRYGEAPVLGASEAIGPWKRLTIAMTTLATVTTLIAGWSLLRPPRPEAPPVTRFTIPVPQGHEMDAYLPNLAVSPDGTIVYFADNALYKRAPDQIEPVMLNGAIQGSCLFFSPDGQWIIFVTGDDRRFRAVSIEGGPVVDPATHTYDSDLVFSLGDGGGVQRKLAGDTAWVPITMLDSAGTEGGHAWPQLLPRGTHVLYTALGPGGMWNDAEVVVEEIGTGVRTTIASGKTYGRYVPSGHVVYTDAEGTLEAVPYDLKNHRVSGNARIVETGVRTAYWGGAASFAISDAGTFVSVRGSSWANHRLTWVDRDGTAIEQVGQPATVEGVEVSPDGRYAVTYVASNNADISLFDLATGNQRPLTFDPESEDSPTWSPDSRRVAYRKVISGHDQRLYAINVSGQGEPVELYADSQFVNPTSWSPDGKFLAVSALSLLRIINLEDQSVDTVTDAANWSGGRFSPDGRWLAYTSSETGINEVYVTSFPERTVKRRVSERGGRAPFWSADSGELFYMSADTLMVSEVTTGDNFSRSTPRSLFVSSDLSPTNEAYAYAVSADGQRILYAAPNPDAPAREIYVVLNWFEELRALAGN